MEARLRRIQQKITAVGHTLGPPMSELQVADFEAQHHVTLPEGYRRFLLDIGNGGDGPAYYGLARLGEAAGDMTAEEQQMWTKIEMLDQVFPFTEAWIWEDEEGMWDDASQDWSDEGRAKLARIERGNVYIGNDGCGQYWHLIVTGPERGNVWQFTGEGIVPTAPKRDFLRWYEAWLDGTEDWWESA